MSKPNRVNSEPAALYEAVAAAKPARNEEEERLIVEANAVIVRRLSNKSIDAMTSPATTKLYVQNLLGHYEHEVFACLMMDNRNRVIAWREMFRGTVDGASVYPREVVKQALADNAAAVILVHNHPSGVAEPSQADIRLTERLKSALALVDIRVLDHIIVGETCTSFADGGLI